MSGPGDNIGQKHMEGATRAGVEAAMGYPGELAFNVESTYYEAVYARKDEASFLHFPSWERLALTLAEYGSGAAGIGVSPVGDMAASTVQAALEELYGLLDGGGAILAHPATSGRNMITPAAVGVVALELQAVDDETDIFRAYDFGSSPVVKIVKLGLLLPLLAGGGTQSIGVDNDGLVVAGGGGGGGGGGPFLMQLAEISAVNTAAENDLLKSYIDTLSVTSDPNGLFSGAASFVDRLPYPTFSPTQKLYGTLTVDGDSITIEAFKDADRTVKTYYGTDSVSGANGAVHLYDFATDADSIVLNYTTDSGAAVTENFEISNADPILLSSSQPTPEQIVAGSRVEVEGSLQFYNYKGSAGGVLITSYIDDRILSQAGFSIVTVDGHLDCSFKMKAIFDGTSVFGKIEVLGHETLAAPQMLSNPAIPSVSGRISYPDLVPARFTPRITVTMDAAHASFSAKIVEAVATFYPFATPT